MISTGRGSRLPRLLLLAVATALIPAVAGCEAGNNAPTLNWHYPTEGAGKVVGNLSLRNVFILGAPLGSNLSQGESASLFFAVVNTGRPDRLISVTTSAASSVTLPTSTVLVGAKPVLFQGPQPQAYLTGLTRPLTSGSSVNVTFNFQTGGSITVPAPIVARAQYFATYSPAPTASASPLAKHARKHHHPAGSPSPTPSASS